MNEVIEALIRVWLEANKRRGVDPGGMDNIHTHTADYVSEVLEKHFVDPSRFAVNDLGDLEGVE